MQCRICGSPAIANRGSAEFYFGYAWAIYDCNACGCRFTQHDSSVADLLYAEQGSRYNPYIGLSEATKTLFDRGDLAGLKAELGKTTKYQFIIDQVALETASARLLEIGCSCGHLTSYFILEKRDITGVDVSRTAVNVAKAAFGDHFAIVGDSRIEARGPYDFIYHVGMIGCIADPIGMTRALLGILKAGGRLVFNAPNRDACGLRGQLWLDSAPPPDVVTMFRPGFWQLHFGDVAEVSEEIERESPQQSLLIGWRKLTGRRWRHPVPIALSESKRISVPPLRLSDRLWQKADGVVRRIGRKTGIDRLATMQPADFGLLVTMQKR
jgi:SAM-dependent methyltransferase